jgi:hypothetical protein
MPSSSATICANGRLVPLALGLDGDPQDRLARRVHAQLRAVGHAEPGDVHGLARSGADGLREERHADAHVLAAGALLGLLAPQLVVARDPQRLAHRRRVVARVVGPAGLGGVRELLGPDEVPHPQLDGSMPSSSASRSTIRSTR